MTVEIQKLCYAYAGCRVLNQVSLSLSRGEMVSVLGPNGAGKSTLLKCLIGALTPCEGSVVIDGRDIRRLSPRELASYMAYIPQAHYPAFSYPVEEMVLMGTTAHVGAFSSPGAKERRLVSQALERVGAQRLAGRRFASLSGGERQLVLIARALAQQARLMILDEPAANLDLGNRALVLSLLRSLTREGYCVLTTTHDPEHAYLYSSRIVALQNGRVMADGRPKDVVIQRVVDALYGPGYAVESLHHDRARVLLPLNALEDLPRKDG